MYQLYKISAQLVIRRRGNIPSRNLHKTCFFALDQGLHPFFGLLGVVDLGPRVTSPKPIHLAVLVAHGVIILYAVRQKKLGAFLARFPPSVRSVRVLHIFWP